MKIIEHGNWYKKFICYRCKCKFEAMTNECKPYFSSAGDIYYYCKCPECGALVGAENDKGVGGQLKTAPGVQKEVI